MTSTPTENGRYPNRRPSILEIISISALLIFNIGQLYLLNRQAGIYDNQLAEMRKSNDSLNKQIALQIQATAEEKVRRVQENAAANAEKLEKQRTIAELQAKVEEQREKFKKSYNSFSNGLEEAIKKVQQNQIKATPEELKEMANGINDQRVALRMKIREMQQDLGNIVPLTNSDIDTVIRVSLKEPVDMEALREAIQQLGSHWPSKTEAIYRVGDKILQTMGCPSPGS